MQGFTHEKHEPGEGLGGDSDEHVGLRHQLQLRQNGHQRVDVALRGADGIGHNARRSGRTRDSAQARNDRKKSRRNRVVRRSKFRPTLRSFTVCRLATATRWVHNCRLETGLPGGAATQLCFEKPREAENVRSAALRIWAMLPRQKSRHEPTNNGTAPAGCGGSVVFYSRKKTPPYSLITDSKQHVRLGNFLES